MATQIQIDEFCRDANDPEGNALKVAPPIEISQTGFLKGTPVARVWLNYILNALTNNSKFVQDDLLKVGTVLSYIQGTQPNFATDFIGTWSSIGTQTIGARTVEYFERTA